MENTENNKTLPEGRLSRGTKHKGFTLVELIVVITILVILGTIAFIQLGSFAGSARDSARISNLTNFKKGLDFFQIKSGSYPMPKDAVTITASGVIIGYQGFAKDQIADIAKLSPGGTQDPSDSTMYTTYSVNATQTKMQAMIFLEDSSTVTALTPPNLPLSGKGYVYLPLIRGIKGVIGLDTTFASTNSDYSKRTPLTKGDTLGILLGNTGATLNQPVQETGTGVDVVLTSTGYVVYFTKDTTATGTGISLITAFTTNSPDGKSISKYDPNLVGYWDMETLTETLLKDLSGKGNDGVCYNSGIAVNCGTTGQGPQFVDGNGKNGKAMSFNGVSYDVTIPSINIENNKMFTISTWIYFKNGHITVWELNSGNWNSGIKTWGNLGFRPGDGINACDLFPIPGGSTLSQNIWTHLVITRNQDSWKKFINGSLFSTDTNSTIGNIPASSLMLGSRRGAWSPELIGSLDEVRIYNRALSDSEISALYNATK